MSAFSEYLNICINQYVEAEKGSKNELITACQVNRSTFFQCLRGTRLPTKALFQTLLEVLRLSSGEEEKLQQLYYIAQIGESAYRIQQWVGKCLATLAALSAEEGTQMYQFAETTYIEPDQAAIYGEDRILQELCHLAQVELSLEEPQIDMFLPQWNYAFFEYLKRIHHEHDGKPIRLRQLIQIPRKREEKVRTSLAFFHFILFFLASGCKRYEAYYYYTDARSTDVIGVLYPYSVVTSTSVLLINEAMDQGVFSTVPEILEACRKQFEETVRKAKPFLKAFLGYEQMSPVFRGCSNKEERKYQYFSAPCFGDYLTGEMIEKYCPDERKALISNFHSGLEKGPFTVCFCSTKGILDFVQTGMIPDYPQGVILPLEKEDRKKILKRMLQQLLKKGGVYLVDKSKLPVSDGFILTLSGDRQILVYRRGLPELRVYQFLEQNLLDAFADYFQALTESPFVRPQAELEQVLWNAIESCS